MRGRIQDGLRFFISMAVRALGRHLARRLHRRVGDFSSNQQRLRKQFGIADDTLITQNPPVGSTHEVDRIAWQRQVDSLRMDAFYRVVAAIEAPRTSLYRFRSPQVKDADDVAALPPYLGTLQNPHQVHDHPAIVALEEEYGRSAVRLWVLILSNPGVLYVTNPFTLSAFLEGMSSDWLGTTGLVRAWHADPMAFDVPVRKIASRIASEGSQQRLRHLAGSDTPLPFLECVPAVGVLCSRDDHLVRPALERIWAKIPRESVHHVPTHSVGEEAVETVPYWRGEAVSFLPLAPGTLYEFLPFDAEGPVQIVEATALEVGHLYTMVVSDTRGLCRLNTQDLFRVRDIVDGVPDLRFERRVGLQFSFMNEQLTGEDARSAIAQVVDYRPDMEPAPWLTVMPVAGDPPRYRFIVAWDEPVTELEDAGKLLDKALAFANPAYGDHRRDGRLGPVDAIQLSYEEAIQCVRGSDTSPRWVDQFVFVPLVTQVVDPVE